MRTVFITIFLFLHAGYLFPQYSVKVVLKSTKGYLLADALVKSKSNKHKATNKHGEATFYAHPGENYCISLLGFRDTCLTVPANAPYIDTIYLTDKVIMVGEVIVSSKRNDDIIMSSQSGVFGFTMDSLRYMPYIAGEADPLKLLQLTPGVSKVDINTGLNVRGGTPDQNMVLLDNATIYSPTHLAGFLSVFNPLAVDQVTLVKSGIPAYYNSKLSSVTDIQTWKHTPERITVKGNAGMVLSGLDVEIPFGKSQSGAFFAGRYSYLGLIIKPLSELINLQNQTQLNQTNYTFYDINAGANLSLSENDRVYLRGFLGSDNYALYKSSFDMDNTISWHNQALSLRWMHYSSINHVIKTVVFTSGNGLNLGMGQQDFEFNLTSRITDFTLQHEHSISLSKMKIHIGAQINKLLVVPNKSKAHLNEFVADFGTPNIFHSITLSPYAHTDIEITHKLQLTLGIRSNYYMLLGPYSVFSRDWKNEITDTTNYLANEVVASYWRHEPRIGFRYILNQTSSLKASATRNVQFLQQVNVAAVSFPTDIWIPATSQIMPQEGLQYSLGYIKNWLNNDYETSIDFYYKNMQQLLEFNNGLLSSTTKASVEENLLKGQGKAYGMEILLKKNTGKLNGWISYTLSKTTRCFKEINNGKEFAAKYDRTHDLSVVVNYPINSVWHGSVVFVYATGNALTLPIGRYIINGNIINQYGEYNTYRMPAYHRMDISFNRLIKKNNRTEQRLVINIYNLYSRLNPYYMYYNVTGDISKYQFKVSPKYVSLFPIIPSINYEFIFK